MMQAIYAQMLPLIWKQGIKNFSFVIHNLFKVILLLSFVPQESKTLKERSRKEKKTYRYTYKSHLQKATASLYILIKHILDSGVWIV